MNSAFLQGTLVAVTAAHGIQRINRHAFSPNKRQTMRLEKYLKLRERFRESKETLSCGTDLEVREIEPMLSTNIENTTPMLQFKYSEDENAPFRINVGGQRFVLKKSTIARRQAGLLNAVLCRSHEERLEIVSGYFEDTDEYFFERSPSHFPVIYQYYLSGIIHQNADVCPEDLLDELKYWQIPINKLEEMCICTMDNTPNDESETVEDSECCLHDDIDKTVLQKLKRKFWRLVEDPNSSKYAQLFAAISVLFVLISITGLVMGSIPELQVSTQPKNSTGFDVEITTEPHPVFVTVEYVCILWFAFEYILKMSVSYDRRKTFFKLLNIIDLLAILPFLLEIAFILVGLNTQDMQDWKGAFLVIRILRVLRVIRVLKLGRYSSGLQLFGKTLKASFRQLGMMAMVVFTGVIFFGTLMYFIEKDEPNSQFSTIPAGCWW